MDQLLTFIDSNRSWLCQVFGHYCLIVVSVACSISYDLSMTLENYMESGYGEIKGTCLFHELRIGFHLMLQSIVMQCR